MVIAFLLAACSTAPLASTAATPPSSSGASVPSVTAAGTTPTPGPTEPFAIHTGELPAGRYLQSDFDPPLSFTLGAGWRAFFDDPGALYFEDAQLLAFGAIRLEKIIDPTTGTAAAAPGDLVAWFEKHPALKDVRLTPTKVAGLAATLVEADATRTQDVYYGADGNFRLVGGARYRIYVVPMDGPDLVITTLGPSPAVFDAGASKLEAIVDSIQVGR